MLFRSIAGEVKGFDVTQYIPAKEARRMDTFIHYGMAVGIQAWKDSGLAVTPENAERIGINMGSGIGGLPMIEQTHAELQKNGPRRISPFFIPSTIINMIAGNLKCTLLPGTHLSIPSVSQGPDSALRLCGTRPVQRTAFRTPLGPIWVTMFTNQGMR